MAEHIDASLPREGKSISPHFAGMVGLSVGMSAHVVRDDAATVERLLFVKDVAAILGVSLSTARARLVALEKRHGSAVVQRSGKRLCTRASALDRVLPGGARGRPHHALEMRVARMERRAGEREGILTVLGDRLERVESQLERLLAGASTTALERCDNRRRPVPERLRERGVSPR